MFTILTHEGLVFGALFLAAAGFLFHPPLMLDV
jgi:hypothetical protein